MKCDNKTKTKYKKEISKRRALHNAFSGGTASIFATLLTHPTDTLRVRIAAQYHEIHYKSTYDAIKHMIKEENLSAFYRGLPTTIVGTCIRGGVGFGIYETGKSNEMKDWETKHPIFGRFFIGFVSSFISVACSYPFDTVRR